MNKRFPWGLYAGDLVHHEDSFPVMLPSLYNKRSGIIIEYHKNDDDKFENFIQSMALWVSSSLDYSLLKIHIFDYTYRKRFPYLAQLKGQYHLLADTKSAEEEFKQLETDLRNRHQNVLPNGSDILRYNETAKRPYPYRLLIINLEDFPEERMDLRRIEAFIEDSAAAGFYFICYTEKNSISENSQKNKIREWIFNYFMKITLNREVISIQKKISPLSLLLNEYNYRFPNLDMPREIEHIIHNNLKSLEENQTEKDFLNIPIGFKENGTDTLNLRLGMQTGNYHALITGRTGSGKSVLLNHIILEIAKKYTAKQIKLFLMDYKRGVEFQRFAQHPNVEKIFLDNNDTKAAGELLKKFSQQDQEREALFRESGVANLDEYNQKYPENILPHCILIIDEVQNIFENLDFNQIDKLNNLLEKIARQGRSWGVHLILCTQTIKNCGLNRNLFNQFGLKITFKIQDETDSIMSMNNCSIPLNLGKYEILYNDDGGSLKGNERAIVNPPVSIEDTDHILVKICRKRNPDEVLQPEIALSANNSEATAQTEPEEETTDDEPPPEISIEEKSGYGTEDTEALLQILSDRNKKSL